MTEAISICFDCKYARADKCTKIRNGVPIEGSVVKPTYGGGYFRVVECPRFENDCIKGIEKIFKLLGATKYKLKKYGVEWAQKIAESKGYYLIVDEDNGGRSGWRHYYLREK